LTRRGHKVHIYNLKDLNWVKKELEQGKYDFVHLQNEDYLPFFEDLQVDKMAVTAHCGWADNYIYYEPYYWRTFKSLIETKHYNFSLSSKIRENYINFGADSTKIFVNKNGVNTSLFAKDKYPLFKDRSVFLGRIEKRKRQYKICDKNLNIDFVGFGDEIKLHKSNKMLGIWSKEDIYYNLTKYPNLVLLSMSEAHPLVCMEALSSGCGLVISENCSANLDITKPFITVINESDMEDEEKLNFLIQKNREISIENRDEIIQYSKNFDWDVVVPEYEQLITGLK
jgi:hypothetical protein